MRCQIGQFNLFSVNSCRTPKVFKFKSLNPNAVSGCKSCEFSLRASVRRARPFSDRQNSSPFLNLFKTLFPHQVITPDRVNFLTALE